MTRPAPKPEKEKKHVPRPFTSQELVAWMDRMDYDERTAAEEIGCSLQSIYNWKNGDTDPPKYIGLACDALSLGMRR